MVAYFRAFGRSRTYDQKGRNFPLCPLSYKRLVLPPGLAPGPQGLKGPLLLVTPRKLTLGYFLTKPPGQGHGTPTGSRTPINWLKANYSTVELQTLTPVCNL